MTRVAFFVVGAQKAGTTTLHYALSLHPQVYLPFDKETKFFANDALYAQGSDYYHQRFFRTLAPQQLAGEADPEYLYFENAPGRIHAYNPEAKIIVILRNPIDRAYSHYLMSVRRGFERYSLAEAMGLEAERFAVSDPVQAYFNRDHYSYCDRGFYARQLRRYFDLFSRERCLVLFMEDLQADPQREVGRIFSFLGLPSVPLPERLPNLNSATVPRLMWLSRLLHSRGLLKRFVQRFARQDGRVARALRYLREQNLRPYRPPPLEPALRAQLAEVYRDEITELSCLLERDLKGWLPGEGQTA